MSGMVWTEPLFRLPRPTGPHAVGRTARDWKDAGRPAPSGGRRALRRLPVWLWYPASETHARPGPYLPALARLTGLANGVVAGRVRAHAVSDATPAASGELWPVVLFAAAQPPLLYTALCAELASHGYLVAAVGTTAEPRPASLATGSFPRDLRERSRLAATRAGDLRFVLGELARAAPDTLRDRFDRDRSAVVGHAIGGAAAAVVSQQSPPVRAGAALDSVLWREPAAAGVETAFLQAFGAHPEYVLPCDEAVRRGLTRSAQYCADDRATTVGAWQALHDSARPGYSVRVRGAAGGSFTDAPMLPLYRWSPLRRTLSAGGGPTGTEAWRAATDLLLAFLDRHLRAARAPLLDRLAADGRFEVAPPAVLFAGR
jgi:dienelactone hydrolase